MLDEKKCPLCGSPIHTDGNPDSMNDSDYCSKEGCPWFANQFISYEDMVEIDKEQKSKELCPECNHEVVSYDIDSEITEKCCSNHCGYSKTVFRCI